MEANAVADPDTMVVHAYHAAIALRAVMRARRLDCLADVTSFSEFLADHTDLVEVQGSYLPNFDILFTFRL